jgi:hypothetical protein
LGVKDKFVEMLPNFSQISEELMEVAKKAEEVFNEPTEKIKAAFGEDAGPFAIPKAVAACAGNVKIAASEPVKIVSTAKDSLLLLNDEMNAAITEVKAMLA